ncbi:MAG: hypothetical protein LBF51_08480, partial [Zoogloeaceae bacterium]|nr:hypothetical protein [Zoogloeaceae bacterium]
MTCAAAIHSAFFRIVSLSARTPRWLRDFVFFPERLRRPMRRTSRPGNAARYCRDWRECSPPACLSAGHGRALQGDAREIQKAFYEPDAPDNRAVFRFPKVKFSRAVKGGKQAEVLTVPAWGLRQLFQRRNKMAAIINTNIPSLNAQRNLTTSQGSLNQ